MISRRVARLAGALCLALVCISCGQVYRPVVIPCTGANPLPGCSNGVNPSPGNFHTIFSLTSNQSYDSTSKVWTSALGTAMQYDVSGDTTIGVAAMGVNPTFAALSPGLFRAFVTNAASVNTGSADTVFTFIPISAFSSAISPSITYSLPIVPPNVPAGYVPLAFPYLPDFVATTQSNFAYVANFGVDTVATKPNQVPIPVNTESVSVLNVGGGAVTNTVYLGAGFHPLSMAQTPNGNKLYVGTQGTSSVLSFNTVDMSLNTVTSALQGISFPGSTPVWAVARSDNQKVYVVTEGNGSAAGELFTIDATTDTVTAANSVGNGANFLIYDAKLNRIYVTNPATATVYIFAASTVVSGVTIDAPQQLAAITIPGQVGCSGCASPLPVSVAALPDGSRAYVASYQLSPGCAENNPASTSGCLVYPQITVIDASSNLIKSALSSLPASQSGAVNEVGQCIASVPYNPGVVTLSGTTVPSVQSVRFRVAVAASPDSTRVYVSMCDAGNVATINAADNSVNGGGYPPDSLVTNLVTPFGNCTDSSCSGNPPRQTPRFILTGQ